MNQLLFLALGGGVGAISRFGLTRTVTTLFGNVFPYATLTVNALGCLIVGFLVSYLDQKFPMNNSLKTLLVVGFCGSFTTFSTYILDGAGLIQSGNSLKALIYLVLSVVLGFVVFRIGLFLGSIL